MAEKSSANAAKHPPSDKGGWVNRNQASDKDADKRHKARVKAVKSRKEQDAKIDEMYAFIKQTQASSSTTAPSVGITYVL
jgi:hypothetical protein